MSYVYLNNVYHGDDVYGDDLAFYALSIMSKDNLNHLNKSFVLYNRTFFKIIFRSVTLAQV